MLADLRPVVKPDGSGVGLHLDAASAMVRGMGRGRIALILAGVAFVVVMAIALWPPQRLDGTGTIYSDFACVGIDFDSGTQDGPVTNWPPTFRHQREADAWVVVDEAGQVVLRPGDRVAVEASLTHADGDTTCSNTNIITVETFERLEG